MHKKSDYVAKLETMIHGGIIKGTYIEANERQDVQRTIVISGLSLQKTKNNQPACLYRTNKTHKFEKLKEITIVNLKFRPINDETGLFTYNVAKVILDHLRILFKNQYSIDVTEMSKNMVSSTPPLQGDEEYLSHDVESLFTDISIEDKINYIIEQVYLQKKLTPICSKLISRRLLAKLVREKYLNLLHSIIGFKDKWITLLWANHYLLLLVTLHGQN